MGHIPLGPLDLVAKCVRGRAHPHKKQTQTTYFGEGFRIFSVKLEGVRVRARTSQISRFWKYIRYFTAAMFQSAGRVDGVQAL